MSEFKAPNLPSVSEGAIKIGLVTSQIEGPVENIDDVETAEVEAEKKSKISIQAPLLDYKPPPWACDPDESANFQLEVLKEGKIIGCFDMKNRKHSNYVIIGRIKPGCDLVMEHPSISRYHCILQYGDDKMEKSGKGWHVYELGSTHGTKMNKRKLPPKQYIRTRVGFVFQFGDSTRIYNLLGPETDTEPEWDCSPTEMKLRVHKKQLEAKLKAEAAKEMAEEEKREKEEEGCGWGMDYGEDDRTVIPNIEADAHLMEDREAYYNQDPRKALAKFFEREGFDMNFEFGEQGQGHTHKWVCSIELPVEIDGVDRAFTASATVSTSKKDAQTQCALEACRILDSYNVLRKSNTKLRMQRKTLKDNDYYDEDDDLYLDRTGQLEAQREKRKKWAEEGSYGNGRVEKDTYETLCVKLENTKKELEECQKMLDQLGTGKKREKTQGDDENLDDYIRKLEKNGGMTDDAKTKTEKSKWRQRLVAATHEMQKLEKLVKIAKPVEVTGLKALSANSGDKQAFLRKMLAAKKAKEAAKQQEEKAPKIEEKEPEKTPEETKAAEPMDIPGPSKIEPEEEDDGKSNLRKRVAQWEEELEIEQEERKKKKQQEQSEKRKEQLQKQQVEAEKPKNVRVRPRDTEKKIGGSEDYGVGCEDRNEKYSTWMPPNQETSEATQAALRAKFAGKY